MVAAACGEPGSPDAPAPSESADRTSPAPAPASPPPLPRPSDPATFVGQHVLVPDQATLHLGPEPGAATVTLRLPPAASERAPTPAVAMRVVAHEGGRLKLQPAEPGLACVPPPSGLAGLDVAVWVEPAALARVLGRAVEAAFPDGTSVELRPGVLVGPPGERVEVLADGLRLAVPIAEGDVSTLYAAELAPAVPTGLRKLGPGAPLTYAGGDPVLPESALAGGGLVLAQRTDGDRTLVRVGSRCAEVEAVVEPARLAGGGAGATAEAPGGERLVAEQPVETIDADEPEPTRGSGAAKGMYAMRGMSEAPTMARTETWSVAAGKPLTWPSGVAAGTTSAERTFDVPPTTHGDRLCFAVAPTEAAAAQGEKLPLCLLATDVTRQDDRLRLAASAGILGLLSAESSGAFLASPYGSDELGTGIEDMLDGAGASGLGVVTGGGGGGGGTGEGTIGLGTLSTGEGGGGSGTASAGPRSDVETTVSDATGLDGAKVVEAATRSRNQVRYCHEKELQSDPGLAGTIRLSLEVASGKVTSASAESKTLPRPLLRCVERSAKRWSLAGDGTAEITLELSIAR